MEKAVGRRIDPNLLPAAHKVQILEFLLTCDKGTVKEQAQSNVAFVSICATLLLDMKMEEYFNILRQCRAMEQEELSQKDRR